MDTAEDQDPGVLRHPITRKLRDYRTRGERLADAIAEHIGSWRFLIIQTTLVALWIGCNLVGMALRWDPYPFVLLNLMFSVQAAYTGPILLLSQNRSAQRDRVMAEHDYATNEKAEQLTESLLSEVLRNSLATLAIARHLGIRIEGIDVYEKRLTDKIEDVQQQLAEVEDVLAEQPAIPTRRTHLNVVEQEEGADEQTAAKNRGQAGEPSARLAKPPNVAAGYRGTSERSS